MADFPRLISVLQLTDPHILANKEATLLGVNTAYYFEQVLTYALQSSRQFDLCLLTGDIAQEPCEASYRYLLKTLEAHNLLTVCLPGNHDDFNLMQDVLVTKLVNCPKVIVLGNWQFIFLNSQVIGSPMGYLSADELAYLEKKLDDNPSLHTLIAAHHHCLPTKSGWMDTMMIENATEFLALIKRYPNAKAIINGHIHQEMELLVDKARVLTAPSTCFQFKPLSENFSLDDKSPGYRWLDLYENGKIETGVERIPETLSGLQMDTHGY